ncbi:hypothetical protein ACFQH6_11335 [Halobacteriaceae archaeon GCM10025711]
MDPIVAQRQDASERQEGVSREEAEENPLAGMEYPCQAPKKQAFSQPCQGTMRYDPDAYAFVCDSCGYEEPLL